MSKLLTVGILLVVVGLAVMVAGDAAEAGVSTGGFILIGPFPIVFGTGSNGGELALISAVLGVLMVALLLATSLRRRNLTSEGEGETDK
ncbi:MAG TPA: DUF131 domain-containing protein [Nitrososphaerales archaeon]|nr:DUF131 domain-containing protein [Nitrososphaerales archaeon]